MEACLIDSVNHSLKLYMYRNATFLCERLYSEHPSESNMHLLATCYFRSNQAYRAYHLLKGTKSIQCRYLFALACFEMDYMSEAEAALLPPNEPTAEVPNGAAGHYMLGLICRLTDRKQAAIEHYIQALSLDPFFWSAYEDLCILGADEDAAALLGDVAVTRLQQQQQQLQWESRAQYPIPNVLFSEYIEASAAPHLLRSPYSNNGSSRQSRQSSLPLTTEISSVYSGMESVGGTKSGNLNGSPMAGSFLLYNTPSPGPSQNVAGVPAAPVRNPQRVPNNAPGTMSVLVHPTSSGIESAAKASVIASSQPLRRKFLDEGKLRKVSGRLFAEPTRRRSSRLSGDSGTSTPAQISSGASSAIQLTYPAGNGSGQFPASFNTSTSTAKGCTSSSLHSSHVRKGQTGAFEVIEDAVEDGRRNGDTYDVIPNEEITNHHHRFSISGTDSETQALSRTSVLANMLSCGSKLAEGALELLSLIRTFGDGFRHLCMYRSQEALQAFSKLPQHHFETGWVLCQVGRAYFEMVDYSEAERAFSWAHRVAPYRLEGSDVYSTVLYHMKKEVELSYLAQETVAMDRLSPQAWCVMGNCFSLQKDHETALKFFQRALQLDSRFTYAHTLCGHECVAMEDFEEGLTCYRNAIRMDARHYNAWYGIGTIYFRQEKYELAEYHFRRALSINSRSSVLHCYLGMALHALKKNTEALQLMERAISADPKNPLPKYQKANILMSEENYQDALEVLEQLKEVAPRESSVYFLMGKIYKRLDQPECAIYNFCIALDLKPSAADVNLIKTAIEKLHVPDELEEENL
ncbi:hypothetical protein O6H91_05G118700 [Diphasiastrum complanatum]|uniref:Uncharacterized protein n=1 Tax=Diphasiastrum complanatum TaxID=34168 RepID=A0ACC2DSL4_DIPCM|nr:hypothetical protein O6H91_05G118700 [Diphasiastrum complanatum]